MALFAKTSILSGLDPADSKSLRRVMSALHICHNIPDEGSKEVIIRLKLSDPEAKVMQSILQKSMCCQIMSNMAARFRSWYIGNARAVCEAAENLDKFATSPVMEPAEHSREDFLKARSNYYTMVTSLDGFPYNPQTGKMVGDVDPDSESEEWTQENSKIKKETNTTLNSGSDVEDMVTSKSGEIDSSAPESNSIQINNFRNTGSFPPGSQFFFRGPRTIARLHVPAPELRQITFQTKHLDPYNPGMIITGADISFEYKPRGLIDWSRKKHIHNINKWRSRVFCQILGRMQPRYTESDDAILYDILLKHLKSTNGQGRWSNIPWNLVAKRFNKVTDQQLKPKIIDTSNIDAHEKLAPINTPTTTCFNRSEESILRRFKSWNCEKTRKLYQDAFGADHAALIEFGATRQQAASNLSTLPKGNDIFVFKSSHCREAEESIVKRFSKLGASNVKLEAEVDNVESDSAEFMEGNHVKKEKETGQYVAKSSRKRQRVGI